jgi:adenylate cyclase
MNAIQCAFEMKEAMREISRIWRKRKNWLNELKLNIGLHEGQEWFGTYQTPTHLEFTALGETINYAGRLSDFAREGSIWVSKNMVSKLTAKERRSVRYGIRRTGADGSNILVPESYSRISNLIDLDDPKHLKFKDIAVMPVTEVLDIDAGDGKLKDED